MPFVNNNVFIFVLTLELTCFFAQRKKSRGNRGTQSTIAIGNRGQSGDTMTRTNRFCHLNFEEGFVLYLKLTTYYPPFKIARSRHDVISWRTYNLPTQRFEGKAFKSGLGCSIVLYLQNYGTIILPLSSLPPEGFFSSVFLPSSAFLVSVFCSLFSSFPFVSASGFFS